MKKIILLLSLCFSISTFAQAPHGKMRERIKAQKVAFITDQLNLSSNEAQQFWPIYNAFEETIENVRHNELRTIKQKLRKNPNMSDSEADTLLNQLITAEDKLYKAKQKLFLDLKGVIPSMKILKLKRAEDEFNRKLLARLKDFKGKRGRRE